MLLSLLAVLTIHTDFEGGSLGRVERVTPTHWRLGSKGEKDQDGRNRQANWYSFRVDHTGPKQPLTFDIVDLPGEYNYRPNRGAITKDTPPVISTDGRKWRHLEGSEVEYDAGEPKLRLKVHAPASRFWIAHVAPYTNEDLQRLRAELLRPSRGREGAVFQEEIIGKSVQGRDLRLWTFGNGPKTVWLMFRQHSWEAGSSWAGEGAIREIAANADLRRQFTWKVFPLCDPDGVARGGVRFNVHGYDLNRNWDTRDPKQMPEITAQRAAVEKWLASGRKIDLFFSLHNTETAEYLEGPPDGSPHRALAERFFKELGATTFHPSRPLFFAEVSTTPGKPGRMNVLQGLYHDHKLPAFLMEQRIAYNQKLDRLPLPQDRLKFGAELVRAMARSLR